MVFGCKTASSVRRDEGSMAASNVICLPASQWERGLNSGSGGHSYAPGDAAGSHPRWQHLQFEDLRLWSGWVRQMDEIR